MKKYFIYAVSALALAGCSSDDFLGGQPSPTKLTDNNVINFNGGSSATTRAPLKEGEAADKLGNKFVVYGYKTKSDGTNDTKSVVYDHYNVKWAGTANHTESNTNGWEYVGYSPNGLSGLPLGSVQTIKYWDYSAEQYDFIAFSFGTARQVIGNPAANQVQASKVTTDPKYTLTGKVEDLAKVYIADRVTAKMTVSEQQQQQFANRLVPYGKPIPFNFRSLGTKVRIGLYEIIPGYSVKDVKFYKDEGTKNDVETNPCLYASEKKIPDGSGTMTVSFPTADVSKTDYNKAHVSWKVADGGTNTTVLSLPSYVKGNRESKEAVGTDYLVRTSTDAKGTTSDNYKIVLPAEVGALKLKVDYTLVSIDGSKETINVKGATAVVPEVYTKWEPNYAYTYIFKISDNTNGSTGGGSTGLYPITFDAIVTETEDGLSETITTVSEPSITTYAKGAFDNDEYKAGSNVYVSVMKGTAMASLGVNVNCALYTAKSDDYNGGITESTVANCIANGTSDNGDWKVVTDAQGKKLTVNKVAADALTAISIIDAADTADGNAITASNGNFAKFTPTAGTYVFEFTDQDDPDKKKYYKVIKVVN